MLFNALDAAAGRIKARSLCDESAFITGQAIAIGGGMSAGPGLRMIGTLSERVAGETFPKPGAAS